jgi:hypothetical protein
LKTVFEEREKRGERLKERKKCPNKSKYRFWSWLGRQRLCVLLPSV